VQAPSITKAEFLEAIRQGVYDAIWRGRYKRHQRPMRRLVCRYREWRRHRCGTDCYPDYGNNWRRGQTPRISSALRTKQE
jgi:hypothetical protein